MKKFILGLLILEIIFFGSKFAQADTATDICYGVEVGDSYTTKPVGDQTFYVEGLHETEASALAAAQASHIGCPGRDLEVQSKCNNNLANLGFGGGYQCFCIRCYIDGRSYYIHAYSSTCVEMIPDDGDEDGIFDWCDPFLGNGDPFSFEIISQQFDGEDPSFLNVKLSDGSFVTYGERDENVTEYYNVGSGSHSSTEYNDLVCDYFTSETEIAD